MPKAQGQGKKLLSQGPTCPERSDLPQDRTLADCGQSAMNLVTFAGSVSDLVSSVLDQFEESRSLI